MIAETTKSNFDRIRNWQGSFEFTENSTLKSGNVADHLIKKYGVVPPLELITVGRIDFVVDATLDACYCAFRPARPTTMIELSKKSRKAQPLNQGVTNVYETVVTPQHYLHFRPGHLYGQLHNHEVAPLKLGSGTQVAFRERAATRESGNAGDVVDPKSFFAHWNDAPSSWLALQHDGKVFDELRAIPPVANPPATFEVIAIGTADSREREYVVRVTIREGESRISLEKVFSASAGYNLTEYREIHKTANLDEEELWQSRRVEFRKHDEIFIPVRIRDFNTTTGQQRIFRRDYALSHFTVNKPVSPDAFTVAVFDLKDGDRVLDQIEGKLFFVDDGKYIPAEAYEPKIPVSNRHILIVGINVVVVLFLLILLLRRNLLARHKLVQV